MAFTKVNAAGIETGANLVVENINTAGIVTANSLSIGSTQIVSSARQLQNIASLDAVTAATIESVISVGPNNFNDLQVTGVGTFVNGPVLVGTGTSTGTANQDLQVVGGLYVSDNVGIGTTNPLVKLQVGGTIGFNDSNIKIGDSSTGAAVTTGSNNFFAGVGAGSSTTTGTNNVFIGRCAGYYNTIGRYNNFFGLCAGFCNTNGCNNNFIGAEAGLCNTTGRYNNFFGTFAGRSNTNGCHNFFGGYMQDVATPQESTIFL